MSEDSIDDGEVTALTEVQQERQEALWAAGSALTSESARNIFTKSGSRTAPTPNALIAAAHFITTGGRDYLPADLDHPLVVGRTGWLESTAERATVVHDDSSQSGSTPAATAEKSGSAQQPSVAVDPDDPWRVERPQ